jgi:hypothetical protein
MPKDNFDYAQLYSDRMQRSLIMFGKNNKPYVYNGINTALIGDGPRNQFYDKMLKQCKDKYCVDVGSGSGLLAFLAIKHGAKFVTCFEQNKKSSKHIRTVAEKMGIGDKIRVINNEFMASKWAQYNLGNVDIIFHELVGSYIWNDMIGNAFNVPIPNVRILPDKYEIKCSIVPLSEAGYKTICDIHRGRVPQKISLNPQIKIHEEYLNYYNDLLNEELYTVLDTACRLSRMPDVADITPLMSSLHSKAVHYHTSTIDLNDPKSYDKENRSFSFNLPNTNNPYLILFHPFLISKRTVLDFKDSTSFSGYRTPIIIPPNKNYKKFVYNVFDGIMRIDTCQV